MSQEDIKNLIESKNPDNNKIQNSSACSQINKFIFDFKKEDYVLTYDSSSRKYLLGKIKPDYYHDNKISATDNFGDYYHDLRDVEWLGEISRDKLKESTKNTLGSHSTIFNIKEDAQKDILNVYEDKSEYSTEEEK